HSLDGSETIDYNNNSPDTLTFIWFHLYANAFKNDRTAFSEAMLREDRTDFYFSRNNQKGYINRLDFSVNGLPAQATPHPQHMDIAKLVLPSPLLPGHTVRITTPFHIQLPYNFQGNGYSDQ